MTPTDEIPLERLEAQITEWSGHIAAGTSQLLGWIAAYDRREGWRSWGCKSAAQWLSWKCGDTLHTAREKVRVARALEDLPRIEAAFRVGEPDLIDCCSRCDAICHLQGKIAFTLQAECLPFFAFHPCFLDFPDAGFAVAVHNEVLFVHLFDDTGACFGQPLGAV